MKTLLDIVGRPYAYPPDPPVTFDCWTLLVWVRQALGLATPLDIEAAGYTQANLRGAVETERASGRWQPVDEPQDGDAVLFSREHIGVSMGSGVLHAHGPSKVVLFTRWPVIRRRWPQVEVWRP